MVHGWTTTSTTLVVPPHHDSAVINIARRKPILQSSTTTIPYYHRRHLQSASSTSYNHHSYGCSTRRYASSSTTAREEEESIHENTKSNEKQGTPIPKKGLDLVDQICTAYKTKETDGILAFFVNDDNRQILFDITPQELIQVTWQAAAQATATNNKKTTTRRSVAARIWNAWIGAYCNQILLQQQQQKQSDKSEDLSFQTSSSSSSSSAAAEAALAKKVQELWTMMEEIGKQEAAADIDGSGDFYGGGEYIVPDIVTYCLVYQSTHNYDLEFATKTILQRAIQESKKRAGSKRRKALAAAKKRTPASNLSNEELQDFLRQTLQDDDVTILENTPEYMILSKPSGVTCYHTSTTTAGKIPSSGGKKNKKKSKNSNDDDTTTGKKQRTRQRQRDISLEDALLHCGITLSTLNSDCLGLVHRLDRGTSGCILISKTDQMHTRLVTAFFLRQVHKQYIALVKSSSPLPFARNDDDNNDDDDVSTTTTTKVQAQEEIITVNLPVHGHAASSRISILERFPPYAAALLQVEPKTGRKHQVRIHCAEGMNSPVLLDPIYSGDCHGNNKTKLEEDVMMIISNDDNDGKPTILLRRTGGSTEEKKEDDYDSSTGSSKKNKKKGTSNGRRKQHGQQQGPTTTTAAGPERFFLHASVLRIPSLNIQAQAPIPEWWKETLQTLRNK